MSAPAIWILIPVEGSPTVLANCRTEADLLRLLEWLRSRQDLAQLVATAVAIRDERRPV